MFAKTAWTRVLVVVGLGLAVITSAVPVRAAPAAVITVNSTDEAVNPTDGKCTLREAITAANTDTPSGNVQGECPAGNGADTIELAPAALYTLSVVDNTDATYGENGLPVIGSELTLNGNGAAIERSAAEGTPEFRLVRIAAGAVLHANQVTLAGGDSTLHGSGIYNAGTLTLTDCTLTRNRNAYDTGGGIYNTGDVQVYSSTFTRNGANDAPTVYGGAIANLGGTLTVADSAFVENSALYAGGAIYNTGTADLSASVFVSNTVITNWTTGGGAISIEGGGTGTIADSTFRSNEAGVYGGALYAEGTVSVAHSTFTDNVAYGSHGSGGGGAIFGSADVSNSTFYRNRGGTFYSGGSAIDGSGTIVNSTFVENEDSARFGSPQAVMRVTLKNSILFRSSCLNVTDGGGNIYFPKANAACGGTPGDPKLGPLQDNGGSTGTLLPAPNSPAVNAAVDANCPATDQRGVTRPQGLHCDSGAVELEPPTAATLNHPANGAHLKGTTVRLKWQAGQRAAGYQLVVRRDSAQGEIVLKTRVAGTRYTLQVPEAGHKYFWRVVTLSRVARAASGWARFVVE